MFTSERRNAIADQIEKQKKVDVIQLSTLYNVSEVTIRKDLEFLEKKGILIRTHGGAILNEFLPPNADFVHDKNPVFQNYALISKMASSLVNENDLIFLGADPLCTAIASLLIKKEALTIVTNNVLAASILVEKSKNRVILAGGQVSFDNGTSYTYGGDVTNFLAKKRYDKIFIGIDGVNTSYGFYIQNADLHDVYSSVIRNCVNCIFCIPGTQFDNNAFYQLAPLEFPNIVVSDASIPENYITIFSRDNIRLYTSYDVESM